MLPVDLVFVRHGESEGNIATRAAKRGDDQWMTDSFQAQHSSRWRLSPKGRAQAEVAGEWLRERFKGIDWARLYVSEYTRALETAGLLGLSPESPEWKISAYLRERSRGSLDRASADEMKRAMKTSAWTDREITPFYWRPPNGESLVEVCSRLRHILDALHRECSNGQVLCVCHGEVMEAIRIELERMSERAYIEWDKLGDDDPSQRINNTQIVWYTRRLELPRDNEYLDPLPQLGFAGEEDTNPEALLAPTLRARRSLLISPGPEVAGEGAPPRGEIQLDTGWQQLELKTYTDADLLDIAHADPLLLDL